MNAYMNNKEREVCNEVQYMMKSLINDHEISYGNDKLSEQVHSVESTAKYKVMFDDENMSLLIAGHVAGSVYDDFENRLQALGYEIIDTDGTTLYLRDI